MGILDALENFVSGGITREKLEFELKHRSGYSPRRFSQQLYQFRKRNLIRENGNGKLLLSTRGRTLQALKELTAITFKNKKTDGHARLIIFDIPEKLRSARNILRHKLKEFECKHLQRSVYITPYVCENELGEVCRILNIVRHVRILKVISL